MRKMITLLLLFCFVFSGYTTVTIVQPDLTVEVGGETTATFQQGVDSYAGCEDAYILDTTNRGDESYIIIKDANSAGYNRIGLIRFDVSSISTGATVTSAKLELSISSTDGITHYVYPCLRDWEETDCDYYEYNDSSNLDWGVNGCRESSTDMTGTYGTATGALDSVTLSNEQTGLATFDSEDFEDYIQTQITAGEDINLVFHDTASGNDTVSYRSSDHGTASARPKLTVVYE